MSQSRPGDFNAGSSPPKPSQAEGEADRTRPNAQQPPKPSKPEGEDFRQSPGSQSGSFGSGIGNAGADEEPILLAGVENAAKPSSGGPSVAKSASKAGREVKDAAMQAANEAKRQASHLASDTRHAVASQAAQLQQKGADYVARQKDCLAEEVSHVGAAVREAGRKLHEEGDDRVASYVDQAAAGIEGVGSYLRDRDAGALCDDFETLARRRPEFVYGGLFLAGLGLARFLKASRRRPQTDYESSRSGEDRMDAYYDDPDSYRESATGRSDPYYATAGYMTSAVSTRYPESDGEENRNVF